MLDEVNFRFLLLNCRSFPVKFYSLRWYCLIFRWYYLFIRCCYLVVRENYDQPTMRIYEEVR